MPRVTFHQLHVGELVNHIKDSRLDFCNDSAHSGILTGSLLPLLCSLLEQSYLKLTDGQDVYVKLVDIVPKIAASLQEQHDGPKSLHQYLKHKILLSLDFRLRTFWAPASLVASYSGFMNTCFIFLCRWYWCG
jgi:hypothetical protein